jgi:hypothetical protein
MSDDDGPDGPDLAFITEARQLAAIAVMLLEHPKMKVNKGKSGLYVTAMNHATLILQLVLHSEKCSDAAEFDALLYLICRHADRLALALSQLQIP